MSTTNKVILCGFGVDVDAVAGWLGSYGGQDSPFDISRGLFAGEVGTPRLLRLYDRYKIKTSWFIPGHSIETFPEQMREVAQAGHEIGAHGYSHENPISMTPRQEEDVLERSIDLVLKLAGKKPRGFVAPAFSSCVESVKNRRRDAGATEPGEMLIFGRIATKATDYFRNLSSRTRTKHLGSWYTSLPCHPRSWDNIFSPIRVGRNASRARCGSMAASGWRSARDTAR